jgi:hypothetical protein
MNIAALMIIAFASGQAPQPFPPNAALQLITHDAKDWQGDVACISVDDRDPSPDLMAEIKEVMPLAAPQSECTPPDRYVVHRPSGKHAAIISISNFRKISSTTATAAYAVDSGPLAGNWYVAKFIFSKRIWKYVSIEMYMSS